MLRKLPKHVLENPYLDSLAQNLDGGRVMTRAEPDTVDTLDFALTQQARAKSGLDERPGIDLVVGPGNGRNPRIRPFNHCKPKSVAQRPMAGIMLAQSLHRLRDATRISPVARIIGLVKKIRQWRDAETSRRGN